MSRDPVCLLGCKDCHSWYRVGQADNGMEVSGLREGMGGQWRGWAAVLQLKALRSPLLDHDHGFQRVVAKQEKLCKCHSFHKVLNFQKRSRRNGLFATNILAFNIF